MRLSFSTRGWQSLDWEQLLESAKESGMNGIELYDLYKRHDLIDRGLLLCKGIRAAHRKGAQKLVFRFFCK